MSCALTAADHVVVPIARKVLAGGGVLRGRRDLERPPLHVVCALRITGMIVTEARRRQRVALDCKQFRKLNIT